MKFDEDFKKYQDIFSAISYLEKMSETYIFQTYKEILLKDSEKAFPEDIP